jgi:hypothetical protein
MRTAVVALVTSTLLCHLPAPGLAGEEEKQAAVETRLKRVALFKNGFGFFVREGTLSEAENVAVLGPFAAPSHGTFWLTAPARAKLTKALVREVKGSAETPIRGIVEILGANVGMTVRLWPSHDPERTVTGKLLAAPPAGAPPSPEPYLGPGAIRPLLPPTGPYQLILLETDDGTVALNPQHVVRVDFLDGEPVTAVPRLTSRVSLEATFESPAKGDWLSVSYLAMGITWAPSYLIDISDPAQARLAAKALIINEAEDLDGTRVDLITGFPNLEFADVLSPMGMREDLSSFLRSLAGDRSRQRGRAAVMSQVMSNVAGYAEAEAMAIPDVPDYGAAAAGQAAGDLFFYPLQEVTLARKERAYYPLFTEDVPYEEIYLWDIPDYINEEDRYGQRAREQPDIPEDVWHSIRLDNTTIVPWTTAPAQLLKDGQIIGQGTMRFTPPKGKAKVKITKAVSVKADQAELEVARERDAVRVYGYHFDRVTIEGKLSVANYKDASIALEVKKTLSGEVKSVSMEAEDVALARGLRRMNPVHQLTWTFELDPGEREEITYTYVALIRR